MRPQIRGRDIYGADLWEGVKLGDHEWQSTGRKHMMVMHYDLEHLVGFYLEYYPNTSVVEYTEDHKFEFVSVPSAMPFKLATVVTEQLIGKS
jgi:hypothetical protein